MSAPGLLHWRDVLPPPEPPVDLLAESADRLEMAEIAAARLCRTYLTSGSALADTGAPDLIVFGSVPRVRGS